MKTYEVEYENGSGWSKLFKYEAFTLTELYKQICKTLSKLNDDDENRVWELLTICESTDNKKDDILNRLNKLEQKFDDHINFHLKYEDLKMQYMSVPYFNRRAKDKEDE